MKVNSLHNTPQSFNEPQVLDKEETIVQIHALQKKAWELRNSDVYQALQFSIDALSLCERISYPKGEAESHRLIGLCRLWSTENQAALESFGKAYAIYETLGDRERIADILYEMGGVYAKLDDYPNALSYHMKSFTLCNEHHFPRGQALSLSGIGFVYESMNDYEKALDYYHRSLDLWERLGEKWGQANVLQNLGIILYQKLDSPEEALKNIMKSLEYSLDIQDTRGTAKSYYLIAEVRRTQQHYESALQNFEKALTISEIAGERFFQTQILLSIGKTYNQLGHSLKAITSLKKALGLAEAIRSRDMMWRCHRELSHAYKMTEDIGSAFEHFSAFHHLKEEIFNEENERRIRHLQIRIETERAQQKAELYRLKNFDLAKANLELNTLKQSLEASNQALNTASLLKTQLLSIAATELKEPLETISIFCDSLITKDLSTQKRDQLTRLVYDLSKRMTHLVTKLLSDEAIRDGQVQIQQRPIGISNLIKLLVLKRQEQPNAKPQKIFLELPDTMVLNGDEDLLKDLFDRVISVLWTTLDDHIQLLISATQTESKIDIVFHLLPAKPLKNGVLKAAQEKLAAVSSDAFQNDDIISRVLEQHYGSMELHRENEAFILKISL